MVRSSPLSPSAWRGNWRRSLDWASSTDRLGCPWVLEVPSGKRERMLGLRGRDGLAPHHAVLLRTRSVHTFGMRFPILAVLLDTRGVVLEVKPMAPGRVLLPRRK